LFGFPFHGYIYRMVFLLVFLFLVGFRLCTLAPARHLDALEKKKVVEIVSMGKLDSFFSNHSAIFLHASICASTGQLEKCCTELCSKSTSGKKDGG
jgi:hypothetical protein